MAVQIQLRRGTAAAWTSADPTLAEGEMGVETDTDKFKIGDGSTAWTSLDYVSLTAASHSHGTSEILTYTDTTNKVIGPFTNTPQTVAYTDMTVMGGPAQQYTQDYTVRQVTGGSAPGYYACVATDSTAPGGGSFSGGSNPGTGIDSILESGDKVRVTYPTNNS